MSRYDFDEIISEKFDVAPSTVEQTIYICSTPRVGSHALARYMTSQGWGVPFEYYADYVVKLLLGRVLADSADSTRTESAYYKEYERFLLGNRVANGIFSAKMLVDVIPQFNKIHEKGFDKHVKNNFIYVWRSDFVGQVASFVTALRTNKWSFSNIEVDIGVDRYSNRELNEEYIVDACKDILSQETVWMDTFKAQKIEPMMIEMQQIIRSPRGVLTGIAEKWRLPFDESRFAFYARSEGHQPYRNNRELKDEIIEQYGDIIKDWERYRFGKK
jgi:LPS sulfotransferase NodH